MIGQITASKLLNNSRHCAFSRVRPVSAMTQSLWLMHDAAQPLRAQAAMLVGRELGDAGLRARIDLGQEARTQL